MPPRSLHHSLPWPHEGGPGIQGGDVGPWMGSPGHCCAGDGRSPSLQSLFPSAGIPRLRRPRTLYPWRRAPTLGRVRRAWVIPPISVSENHKRLPFPLVQVRGQVEGGPEGVCFRKGKPWGHRPSDFVPAGGGAEN